MFGFSPFADDPFASLPDDGGQGEAAAAVRGGMALTERERRRWGFVDTRYPSQRRRAREDDEIARREEIGLIAPKTEDAIDEKQLPAPQEALSQATRVAAPQVARSDEGKLTESILREVSAQARAERERESERREIEIEQRDVQYIIKKLLKRR